MKKINTVVFLCFMSFWLNAQSLSPKMERAYRVCVEMSRAVGAANTAGLKTANEQFRIMGIQEIEVSLLTDDRLSLDGHFLWDECFVDSLIAGRNVRQFAQKYASARAVRSTSTNGGIYGSTLVTPAGASAKFTFKSRGHTELCVVAEPGGMMTLRIHDKTNDVWYNDDDDVNTGRLSRVKIFDLPKEKVCILEVEVINCSDKDSSFIILSN